MTINKLNAPSIRMLTLADGGSLFALQKKGNLTHVESLYNPNNYFEEVHILVFDKKDLTVPLSNPTLKVHYLSHLPFGKLGCALSLPFLLFQTIRIIRKHNIQIVRARNAYIAGILGVLAGKLTCIPTVVSLGGNNRLAQQLLGHYYGGNQFLSYHLEEFSLRRADRVFCVNKYTRQYALRLGVLPEKTRIVPHRLDIELNEYDCDKALIANELNLEKDPIIVIIGRLERDKQVDIVVEAISPVYNLYSDVKFIFVGDGTLRSELELRAQTLHLTDVVKFVGFQPRNKVIKYLSTATIVCIPMSGFVMYEAAAAKKPIVAFDIEWHSEFVCNGETGILVKNRNVAQLANALIELLNNPEKASQLGTNAYLKLKKQFDQQTIIEKEIDMYKELCRDFGF